MRNSKYWFCQLLGWGIYGIYDSVVNYLSGRDIKVEIQYTIIFILFSLILTHCYRLFIIKKFNWDKLDLKKLLPRVIIATIIMASVMAMYIAIVGVVIKERTAFQFYFFLIFFLLTLLMILVWNLIYFISKYIATNTELSLEKVQMESALKDLELKNIKASLQPHFIFNSLNTIRSLIIENQEKARDAVMQLSNILRNSLISDKAELVKLETELNLVKDYLSLETMRFEERLVVTYKIESTCLQSLIPPLLLQTLVENAIKHGVAASSSGGFIDITIYDDNNIKTIIKIENTGRYLPNRANREGGFGLDASKKRLFYLYGNYASLTVSNYDINSVITILQIPK